MPSGRSKEDTWTTEELQKSMKDTKDEHRRRDKDRDKHRDRDKDRNRDKNRDKEHRRKDNDDERRERHHRDKENGHHEEKSRSKRDEGEDSDHRRHRRHRDYDEDDYRERHRRHDRHRDYDDEDGENSHRRHRRHHRDHDEGRSRDKDGEREKRREHHRRRDEDYDDRDKRRERHHRSKDEGDRKERKHRDKDERHHRDDKDRSSRHRDDEGKERRRHRDEDGKERRHHRDEDGKERRHREDRDKDKSRRDKDRDDKDRRRHRDRDGDEDKKRLAEEEEERQRRREKRERRKREEEEERQRQEREKKKKEEEDEYNYDDDDFEDYDDDFEDDQDDDNDDDNDDDDRDNDDYNTDDTQSNTSSQKQSNNRKQPADDDMDEILQAMNKENERLLRDSKRQQYEDEERQKDRSRQYDRPASSKQTFINFISAKQRQISSKASSKVARRGQELLELIELDVTSYDMFDMPPVTEYSMYMRSFGSSNTHQAYVQTNDDNMDRELQTEEIETSEKWSQHPPSDIVSSGGPDDDSKKNADETFHAMDTANLGQFLEAAGQVINILIEESYLDQLGHDKSSTKQSNIIISDAFMELSVPEFLKDRPVIKSYISPVQTHMLLTVHSTPEEPSDDLLTRLGCVCVWNVNEPSRPQKLLTCESRPRCCCFSPTKTSLVFAGMHDGAVVVWDLREQAVSHRSHHHKGVDWTLRYPTYSTAGVLAYDNHLSAVVAVQPIVAAGESESASLSGLAQSESTEGTSFQLATLEENGSIQLWVAAELSNPDLAGSESDFGLSPGGKVKLIKSSSILLESPLRDTRLRTTMKCADMQLLPSNNSHYYVASDTGCVLHGLRYGGKAPPRAYRSVVDNLVQVTSIDFSPFSEPIFLAGCADGSLRLHHADTEWPLVSWPVSTSGRPIQQVSWCRSRPSVFFVLDTSATLYIWDLLMDDSMPLKQEQIAQTKVTSMSLSNDHAATGLGVPGRRPQVVVCMQSGACEVHTVSQQFSALMADELDQFAAYLKKNG